jgi:HK97 family phage portal protein
MLESFRFWVAGRMLGKQAGDVMSTIAQITGVNAPRRGSAELIRAYKQSPWLRGAVAKIANHTAAVPWQLFAQVGGKTAAGETNYVRNIPLQSAGREIRSKMIRRLKQAGELVEIVDHPLLELLAFGNPALHGVNAWKVTQTYYELKGEIFWVYEKDRSGRPAEFWPVPPHWVTKVPEEPGDQFELTIKGRLQKFDADDIQWLRDPDPSDPYGRGTGVGESLADEIETDEYASKFIKTFFYNRAKPDMMIGVEGAKREALLRAKQQFEDDHRGFWRAHRTFWHPGKITVHELNQKFSDMELSELRQWERDVMLNVWGIPPEIMGIVTSSNRATAHEARRIFADEVLIPRLDFMRNELQIELVPRYDKRLILDYVSPSPDDEEMELEAMRAAPWAVEVGEWRERMGLQSRGEGDRVQMVPINLLPQSAPTPDIPEVTAGAKPRQLKGRGKAITDAQADEILASLRPERLRANVRPLWDNELKEWGQAVLVELGVDPTGFDLLNPLVVEHLTDFAGNRIDVINGTTLENLRTELVDAVRFGEGIPESSQRVATVFETAKSFRSTRIARTEVARSANFGTFSAHKLSGVVDERQWVATPDDRVRDDHWAINGDKVGIDEEFVFPDGVTTFYPGDSGIPEHDINERCTTVAVISEPKDAGMLAVIWRAFDRQLIPWERAGKNAFARGFAEQEDEVLAAVERVLAE